MKDGKIDDKNKLTYVFGFYLKVSLKIYNC